MVKSADTADLKSADLNRSWGFKSPSGHQENLIFIGICDVGDRMGIPKSAVLKPLVTLLVILSIIISGRRIAYATEIGSNDHVAVGA
jgi:hypothetical protein